MAPLIYYLRRLYRDPVTGLPEWGLVKDAQGGISGVHSLSEARPLKTAGFRPEYTGFERAERHADWVFIASRQALRPPANPPLQLPEE